MCFTSSIHKFFCLLAFSVSLCFHSLAQKPYTNADSLSRYGINPNYQWIQSDPVQQKNFYLLTILAYDGACRDAIEKDAPLAAIYRHYKATVDKPDMNCGDKPGCYTAPMFLDSADINAAAQRLVNIYKSNTSFRNAIHRHMRQSGVFIKWAADNDETMLANAWKEEATDINRIITRYTTNKGFRYPDIDSSSFYIKSEAFRKELIKLYDDYKMHADTPLFFYPSMKLALGLLGINRRNEAARHEPLSEENRAAYDAVVQTDWGKYPYSVILILGEGPEDKQPISTGSKRRCDVGAALFRQKQAPFIVVSGGYVHPFQTPYSEAIQMRKYLEEQYRIPASAIIVEPHARHTTTNIRNTDRIIFRSGIPANKKILCTSANIHIASILSRWFDQRNLNELGYLPYSHLEKVTDSTAAFYPVAASLYQDANDPLDP